MSDNINFDYKNLSPFKWFVLENFPFIEADFDALTEWQLFCKIGKEINKIIDSQNIVGEQAENLTNSFNTLYNYVHNYFDNLDVQEEVNNKLNQMAESGELEEIIAKFITDSYFNSYDNLQTMIADNTLIAGNRCFTLGYYTINDGGKGIYNIVSGDYTENGGNIVKLDNGLYAILVNDIINVKQWGAKGDGITDDTVVIQKAINSLQDGQTLLIPKGNYKITPQAQYHIIGYGNYNPYYGLYFLNKNNINVICEGIIEADISMQVMNIFAFQTCKNVNIKGLYARYNGTVPLQDTTLQSRTLCHINNSTNVNVENCYSENVGGCVIYTASNGGTTKNCKGIRTNLNYKSPALFGIYAGQNITFDSCIGYGSTNDGDISIFGACRKNIVTNCRIFNSFEDSPNEIAYNIAQGICVDSSAIYTTVTNCYAFGYYYGIDVKTSCDGVIVSNNQVEKCKVGIAVRLGEGNAPTCNTIVSNNTIYPNGGNGSTSPLVGDFYLSAILVEDCYGVQILNNIMANHWTNPSTNTPFIGILYKWNKSDSVGYKVPTLIQGNNFNFENRLAVSSGSNNCYAIYMRGTENYKLDDVIINDNIVNSPFINATQYELFNIAYVSNLIVSNNIFTNRNQATSNLLIDNCTNVNISSNNFGSTRSNIKFTNSDFVQVIGNIILSPSENYYTVIFDTCSYCSFKNNTYRRLGSSTEAVIVIASSSNHLHSAGNTCFSSNSDVIVSNPTHPSTDIVNDTSNVLWNT